MQTPRSATGTRIGFHGPDLRDRARPDHRLRRRVRRLLGLPRAAPGACLAAAGPRRHALPAPRLSRGALREGAARPAVRPRVLPQRDHLGLRLRRAVEEPLAGQARHDPGVREGSRPRTTSTAPRSTASPTWHRAWSARRRRRAASCPPTSGGTPSSRRPARRRPATRRRSPKGVVRRMVQASSRPGDWVLDFFAGSGTLGAVARAAGRRFVLIDSHPEAIAVMRDPARRRRVQLALAAASGSASSRRRRRKPPSSPHP